MVKNPTNFLSLRFSFYHFFFSQFTEKSKMSVDALSI